MENPYISAHLEPGIREQSWNILNKAYEASINDSNGKFQNNYKSNALRDAVYNYYNQCNDVEFVTIIFDVYLEHFNKEWK